MFGIEKPEIVSIVNIAAVIFSPEGQSDYGFTVVCGV